jgi:hypothetical protein
MPRTTNQFFAIAGLAIKELLRQPISLLLTLTSSTLTVLLPQAIAHQLGQQANMARDSALAFQLIFGGLLSGYAASSTLHAEYLSGTVLTVFCRPVGRSTFYLAKLAAIATLISLFTWISIASSLMTESMAPQYFETNQFGLLTAFAAFIITLSVSAVLNYRWHVSFSSTAFLMLPVLLTFAALLIGSRDSEGVPVAFASRLNWKLIPAGAMGGLVLFILATIALTLATRLKPAPTVAALTLIFSAGLVSDYLITLCPGLPTLQFALRSLLPDIQSFWMADDLMANTMIPMKALWRGLAYTMAYCTGVTGLGIILFRHRDF